MRIHESVESFQRDNPLVPGIAHGDLRVKLGRRVRPEVFRAALEELAIQKKLEIQVDMVKRPGSGVVLQSDEQIAKERLRRPFEPRDWRCRQ